MNSTQLVNIEGAAAFLGLKPSTLRAYVLRRRIPYVKIGRAVRIKTSDLEKVVEAGTVPAKQD